MHTLTIEVLNIKCGGCAATIKKQLEMLPMVNSADVDVEHGRVDVTVDQASDRTAVSNRLQQLGYPEVGNESLKATAKSFVSCMIGRLDK